MCHVDKGKFKGFAFRNETNSDIAVIVNSEVSFTKEFILRPLEVYYALVGDLISVTNLEWAIKSHISYLYPNKERGNC
jgi:hypothetical protein